MEVTQHEYSSMELRFRNKCGAEQRPFMTAYLPEVYLIKMVVWELTLFPLSSDCALMVSRLGYDSKVLGSILYFHYFLLLFILTTNGFSPGSSGIKIRHNTQTTHIT
jgi:hypothetical protein